MKKKCVPCVSAQRPLNQDEMTLLADQLDPAWKIVDVHHLERTYRFKNFKQALDFTNIIGKIAEEAGHHPDLFLSYGQVQLKIWTHKVDGLTESDFLLAEKIEAEYISHSR